MDGQTEATIAIATDEAVAAANGAAKIAARVVVATTPAINTVTLDGQSGTRMQTRSEPPAQTTMATKNAQTGTTEAGQVPPPLPPLPNITGLSGT
jgi:hypothetical protein